MVSYSEKSIRESRGSRQRAWELECDTVADDCDEDDIVSCLLGIFGLKGDVPWTCCSIVDENRMENRSSLMIVFFVLMEFLETGSQVVMKKLGA
jgi:hypothetical protein